MAQAHALRSDTGMQPAKKEHGPTCQAGQHVGALHEGARAQPLVLVLVQSIVVNVECVCWRRLQPACCVDHAVGQHLSCSSWSANIVNGTLRALPPRESVSCLACAREDTYRTLSRVCWIWSVSHVPCPCMARCNCALHICSRGDMGGTWTCDGALPSFADSAIWHARRADLRHRLQSVMRSFTPHHGQMQLRGLTMPLTCSSEGMVASTRLCHSRWMRPNVRQRRVMPSQ